MTLTLTVPQAARLYEALRDRDLVEAIEAALDDEVKERFDQKLRPHVREGETLRAAQTEAQMTAFGEVIEVLRRRAEQLYRADVE